jgi:outer membrane protein assembly factor BamA
MFAKAAAGLLIVLATATPATSQDSRAAELQRRRADKSKTLAAYQPGKLERLVLKAEDGRLKRLISPHNGFFLAYGYTERPTGSGIAFGGGWRHDLFQRQARLVLEAGASFKNYQIYRADFFLPRLADGKLELGVEGAYRRQPEDDFYGLGPDTTLDQRVSYKLEARGIEGRGIVRPTSWLDLGTRFGFISPTVGPGSDSRIPSIERTFDLRAVPALVAQPDYRYVEVFAVADNRDEPGNARAGGYYSISLRQHSDVDLDQYSFRLFDVHARHFFPIFDKKRVFALQAELAAAAPATGNDVPFYVQPYIGGSRSLRSVDDYRFRDRSTFNFSVEYRWEAFSALDMALFTDFGTVAGRVSDLDLGNLKPGYGIGFRFNTPSTVFFRFDIATGAGEGVHYYFKFSNAF